MTTVNRLVPRNLIHYVTEYCKRASTFYFDHWGEKTAKHGHASRNGNG